MKWRLKKWKIEDEEKKVFPRIFEEANGTLKRKELSVLKGLILQELCLWGHKCLLAHSKKCSKPFRMETQEAVATCHKSPWLWLKAVAAVPVYTLGWELSPSSQFWGILYSTGCTSRLFWWRKCKSFWNCHLSKWEVLQYFYSGGTWTISVGNQFYSISFFPHDISAPSCKTNMQVYSACGAFRQKTLHWSQQKPKA